MYWLCFIAEDKLVLVSKAKCLLGIFIKLSADSYFLLSKISIKDAYDCAITETKKSLLK